MMLEKTVLKVLAAVLMLLCLLPGVSRAASFRDLGKQDLITQRLDIIANRVAGYDIGGGGLPSEDPYAAVTEPGAWNELEAATDPDADGGLGL